MKSDAPGILPEFDHLFSFPRLLAVLALLMLVSYPDVVLGSNAFSYRDSGLFAYPIASYCHDRFWHGEMPLWNPYNHCGIPLMAQWNTLTLYPFSLFYLVLPLPWSLNYFLLAHIFLATAGMYCLAHRWFGSRLAACIAGLAFGWNGLSIHCLMWPSHTVALGWMPWIILGVNASAAAKAMADKECRKSRRQIFWTALAGACQILSGSPEIILLTWTVCFGCIIAESIQARRIIGVERFFAVVCLTAALSAAQLLPVFDILAHGDRGASTGNNAWSLPPWGVANFLVPMFHLSPSVTGVHIQLAQQWTSSYYVGIVVVLLAFVAVWKVRDFRVRFLTVIAVLGILLAMGNSGLLLPVLKRVLPFLGFIRYEVKFIVLTVFALPLLAAAGVVWVLSQPTTEVRRTLIKIVAVMGACMAAIVCAGWFHPFPDDVREELLQNGGVRFLVLVVAAVGMAAAGRSCAAWVILLVLMGLDVCTHVPRQIPTVLTGVYGAFNPPMKTFPKLGESRAMLTSKVEKTMGNLAHPDPQKLYLGQRTELFSDCNLLNLIPCVNGFFSLHLREQAAVARLLETNADMPRLREFLGVSQLTSEANLFSWERQTNFMPMATIGQTPVYMDDEACLKALASPDFAPRRIVYLPLADKGQVSATGDPGARIVSSQVKDQECLFETETTQRALLVVAQTYYHCWTAQVDGKPARLLRANEAFQAVEVPPGKHEVRLVYRDRMFQVGLIISMAAVLGGWVMSGKMSNEKNLD